MIHVVGSTGFIGKNIRKQAGEVGWKYYSSKRYLKLDRTGEIDIFDSKTWGNLEAAEGDKIVMLSWKGLPNYEELFHLNENLLACFEFIRYAIKTGVKEVVVAGTCFEYGIQNGCLKESAECKPGNSYSVAKDTLRRMLECTLKIEDVKLKWLRIFYPYGIDQNERCLYPSLIKAIKESKPLFNTSQGDQIRDFIHIDKCCRMIIEVINEESAEGIINIGSGRPVSIRDFLEEQIKLNNGSIELNLGHYPRRKDEPLAFWADLDKYKKITEKIRYTVND